MHFSRKFAAATAFISVALAGALALGGGGPVALASPLPFRAPYTVKAVCAAPRPHAAACTALRLLPASVTPASSQASAQLESEQLRAGARPAVTNKSPAPGALTPQLLHAAYALPSETSTAASQTIAVVDAYNDPTAEADLAVYDKQFELPECTKADGCFRKINENGGESPLPANEGGWATEISIDVQMAHAICQNCHVLLVEANSEEFSDLGAGVNAAVKAGATEISNSYASLGVEASEAAEQRELNERAYDHPSVVITASSGDCGYRDRSNPEGDPECDGLPADVGFPAASPDVVAVGGTALSESDGSWSSTVWENSGGGCSSIFDAPLWQSDVAHWSATDCGSERLSADVSAIADPYTGIDVYDSTPEARGAETGWLVYGGTSVASPIVAAEFALSGGARGVQYPAQTLYKHVGEASALYDVVSGANGSCKGATSCTAAAGYDGPSGVGSPLGLAAFAPSSGTPANTTAPSISGTTEVGQTLTATPGVWTNSPTSTGYQWEDCNSSGSGCVPIQGATAQHYTLATHDSGSRIRVQETASNGEGFGAPAQSGDTAVVPDAAAAPVITKLSPTSGREGTVVTITGANFVGVTGVSFGSTKAEFKVESEGVLTAQAPPGTGTVVVSVTSHSGSSAPARKSKDRFRYKKARR